MGFGVLESKVRVVVGLLFRLTMSRECERLGKGFGAVASNLNECMRIQQPMSYFGV